MNPHLVLIYGMTAKKSSRFAEKMRFSHAQTGGRAKKRRIPASERGASSL
jgi:hypothetical protein